MAELIVPFLQSFITNPYLLVVLVSFFPLIELKGAIPIGVSVGLGELESFLLSYLGSTLVIIPIFFLLIYVFKLLKKIPILKKFVLKVEAMFDRRAQKIAQKRNGAKEEALRKYLIKALFIFVAIPLPLTGVWTGTAIAVFLNMKFKDSILPLALGNLVAGILVVILTKIFGEKVDLFITIIFLIALVMLIVLIIKIAISKPKEEEKDNN